MLRFRPPVHPARIALALLVIGAIGAAVAGPPTSVTPGPVDRAATERAPDPVDDPHAQVRGMTISCQTWGWEWGTDEMVETMEELAGLGVNWIAIHPYASIRGDGAVGFANRSYDDPVWLTRPIHEAHRLGLKVMVIPHLAYWGSPFSWKGDIGFEDEASWNRFFSTYQEWIERLAEICSDADAFVVGCELDRTLGFEQRWRTLIAAVRSRTDAPLTFASNWTDYHRVPFWDALDVIGIQAYFPLVAHEREPSTDELNAGWRRVMATIEAFAQARHRKVVFTELGYDRTVGAAREPWASGGHHRRRRGEAPRPPDPAAERIQLACLEQALDAVERSEVVTGAFLWKWFPGGERKGDFRMSTPGARSVIRRSWTSEQTPTTAVE